MLEFASYLKENFKEDISSSEKIIKDKWDKVVAIIKEAFDDQFSDKKIALYRIQNEFIDKKIAPPTIDIEFLKNNMEYVIEKVNSLEEGEIRIIINNDVQKGAAGVTGIEAESTKKNKKKKVIEGEEEVGDATIEFGGTASPGGAAKMFAAGSGGDAGEGEGTGEVTGDEEEKVVKLSVNDENAVVVEPSENTGLQKSEHPFESKEEAVAFISTLEQLFQGFKVEKPEPEEGAGDIEKVTDEPTGGAEENAKINKKLVTEEGEPEAVAGEEPEDAGEEPEDAGEEPEDAGEEPEDAGEEPEDADAINWEDMVNDAEGEEAEEEIPVYPSRPLSFNQPAGFNMESLDLTKLIDKLIKVEDSWYKVTSITEDKQIVGVNKEGKESKFNFDQIGEMECDIKEMCGKCAGDDEECIDKPEAVEEEVSKPKEVRVGDFVFVELRGEGDVQTWVVEDMDVEKDEYVCSNSDGEQRVFDRNQIDPTGSNINDDKSEEVGAEEETTPPEAGAEEEAIPPKTAEEGLSFAKLANRYLDEDMLSAPTMTQTQGGGMTSKIGMPPEKLEKPGNIPSSETKPGPEAALTAKPASPKEKLEPVGKVPTEKNKPGPDQKLTSKPKAPPRKIEKVSAPKEMPKKNAPKGSFTSKPMKVKTNISNVKAPNIDSVYKKGGFKG